MPSPGAAISFLTRLETALLLLEKWVILILFPVLAAVTFAQVVFRYVLSLPLSWSEELAIGLFIWITFIGSALALAANGHFGLELVRKRLRHTPRTIIEVVIWAVSNAFLLVVAIYGVAFVLAPAPSMTTLPISMRWFYAAVPVGATLMLLHLNILAAKAALETFERTDGA